MGIFLDYWKMAFFNVRSNKVRAFLTMLGIIIGISSVVTIMSIGKGMSNFISGSLSSLAGSYYEIYTNEGKPMNRKILDNLVSKYDENISYTEVLSVNATAKGKKEEVKIRISSGSPSLELKNSAEIVQGRYFDEFDYDLAKEVCIIDENTAIEIFGNTDAIGKTIVLDILGREVDVKVLGIRKSASAISALMFGGNTHTLEMPSTILYNLFGIDPDAIYDAMVFVDKPESAPQMAAKGKMYVAAALNERGEEKVKTYELNSGVSQFSSIMTGITVFVMLVAAISLFVGGVGVMNIMLVSVTERTREIGIRKSLGAGTKAILWQFLIESGLISLTGGVIGIISGYGFSLLISLIAKSAANISVLPDFNIALILLSAVFSMAIGIFFGFYPAKKAAKMTPIEALRS